MTTDSFSDDPAAGFLNGAARSRLLERLHDIGVSAPVLPYPEHATIEEGKALRGAMEGTFTKNLFLKDKKGCHFLVAVQEDRQIDLKTLHRRLGASGRLSFVGAERIVACLGVQPGALTPLGLINDHERVVNVVIDSTLIEAEQVNFHPLLATESIGLTPQQLLAFIRSCDREPMILNFEGPLSD
jgi:Ala-tRNA(Pro) deacylase